jgi:predicted RNase H-like nuclease (RuvC/YqgF family)
MSRLRTVSQYTNVRHNSKRHCRDDLACAGCCSCVEQLNNQNKILKEKVERLTRESQDREKLMARMSKAISDLEKRKEEFDKIEDFKAKVRETIRK